MGRLLFVGLLNCQRVVNPKWTRLIAAPVWASVKGLCRQAGLRFGGHFLFFRLEHQVRFGLAFHHAFINHHFADVVG